MARCTIPDMFELIATGSSPLTGVHNNLALSSLSNSSPTAVAFAKARVEPSASPPTQTRTYAETDTRVQRRQLYRMCWFQQTWQHEIVDMRTSSDKDVRHYCREWNFPDDGLHLYRFDVPLPFFASTILRRYISMSVTVVTLVN
jgi:hypothetical protein